MLNTVRFAAIVDQANLPKFKEAALVPFIKKNDAEVETRREKMDAMLATQIKEWTENKDKYPDKFSISFNANDTCNPAQVIINVSKPGCFVSNANSIYGRGFSLSKSEKRGEWLQTFAYDRGWVSPEKQLKSFLKKADFEIKKFMKQNP